MGKGGGSPAPSTQTVQQSNIPEYARPYFEDIMTRGTTASNVQYQPYTGERVAPFSPLQQQAFEGTQQLGPSPLIGAGAGLTGLAAQQAAQAGQYQPLAPQQMYQSPEFQGMGLEYLTTQAPQLQQYQMGPAERVQGAQTGAAMTDYAPNLRTFQMGPAERARTGSFAAPGAAESYMTPYMQNVVDIQQREAQRQADIARTQRGAQAVGAGAFGGSRQAIMEAEAARNLAQQKGDIQAQGLQSAYQQAQQAYQTDAQRQLQAQLANQQAGLTVGQQNLASALGVQQLGAQTGLQTSLANQQAMQQAMLENARMQQQAALANQQAGLTTGQQNLQALLQTQGLGAQTGMQAQQLNQAAQLQAQQQALGQQSAANQFAQQNAQLAAQYGLAGLQAGEQSRQFGANLGMQGAGMLGQLGGQFGQLGQQAFGQQAGALQAQQQAGAIQQAQGQQQRDLAYEEFMRQQLYPQSQLQFLSSLLRGSVVAPQQTMYTYQQQPSAISQLGGLGLGALGMSRAFGAKEGGEVPGYADGGITGGDDKTQGVTPSRVTNVKKQLLSGIDPRKIPDPLGVMIALQDRDFVKQLQISAAAKNQQALEGGRQQAPSVYDEKMGEAAGLAGMDAGVMEEPYAGGGIVAFEDGGVPRGQRQFDITDPFGIYSGLKALYNRPSSYATSREEARARRLAESYPQGLYGTGLPEVATPPSGIAATLPQSVTGPDQLQGRPANRSEDFARPGAAPMPTPSGAQPAVSPVRPAATAAPAVTPAQPAPQEVPPKEIALLSKDAEEEAYRKRMQDKFPSDLKERLEDLKAQGQQAREERDADRWLAVAMGGFAAAAGQSPYALQNFAQGLGVTTKEMRTINKDFRAAEDARKKMEREERRADRLEQMGQEEKAFQVRQNVDRYNLQAQAANQKLASDLRQTNAYLTVAEGRERTAREQIAATREGTAEARETRKEQRREATDAAIHGRVTASLKEFGDKIADVRTQLAEARGKAGAAPTPEATKRIARLQATLADMESQYDNAYSTALSRVKGAAAAPVGAAPSGGGTIDFSKLPK